MERVLKERRKSTTFHFPATGLKARKKESHFDDDDDGALDEKLMFVLSCVGLQHGEKGREREGPRGLINPIN